MAFFFLPRTPHRDIFSSVMAENQELQQLPKVAPKMGISMRRKKLQQGRGNRTYSKVLTEALDFSQVRSERDAQLLDEARNATKSGDKMSREQYGALRRKIGGTYMDFFKSYLEVEGQYVEEGWVDKTWEVCKKDKRGSEARQVDKFGKYLHVSC